MRNVLLTLILALTLSTSLYAGPTDQVHFANANLKAAIEATLGKANPTEADMGELTSLYAHDRSIKNIQGLEYATNLTYLNLYKNNINDISLLTELTALTSLNLYKNNINDISPLAGLTSLTTLFLQRNNISDISPLAGLTSLANIHLFSNNISDISPLAEITSTLKYLDLNDNPLNIATYTTGLAMIQNNNPWVRIAYAPFTGGANVLIPSSKTLLAGRMQLISWSSELLNDVNISYSLDNGNSWIWIASVPSPDGAGNRYIWEIPQPEKNATECLIRIQATDYPSAADTCDTTFTIIDCTLGVRDGDINDDCIIDLADFAIMANNWLSDGR